MVTYSIIAALSENYVIANDDGIPWHIPEDLEHYRRTVKGHLTVCGRKTYEDTPVLQGRESVVITSQEDYETEHKKTHIANSIDDAVTIIEEIADEQEVVYIIGGESIYSEFLNYADEMVLSHVHGEYDGNIKFPKFNERNWRVEHHKSYDKFDIKLYRRINSTEAKSPS